MIDEMTNENVEKAKAEAKKGIAEAEKAGAYVKADVEADIEKKVAYAKADIKADAEKAKADVENKIAHTKADAEKRS
jgi:hypothetical protein